MPCFHALSHDGPRVPFFVPSTRRTTVAYRSPCRAPLPLRALSLQALVDVLLAMDVTTPVTPRVRRFVLFVSITDERDKDAGHKDVGQKDGAPQAAPSLEFPLISGEDYGPGTVWHCSGPDTVGCRVGLEGGDRVL